MKTSTEAAAHWMIRFEIDAPAEDWHPFDPTHDDGIESREHDVERLREELDRDNFVLSAISHERARLEGAASDLLEAARCVWAGVSDNRRRELDGASTPDATLVMVPVIWGGLKKLKAAIAKADGQ